MTFKKNSTPNCNGGLHSAMVRHKMLPPTLSTIGRNEPSRLSCSIPDSILDNLRSEQTFSWILRLAFPAVSLAEPNPPLPFLPLIEVSFASPSTWLIPFKNPQVHLVECWWPPSTQINIQIVCLYILQGSRLTMMTFSYVLLLWPLGPFILPRVATEW